VIDQLLGTYIVGIDMNQLEQVLVVDFLKIGLKMRKLRVTAVSPRRPEVDEHNLATLLVEVPFNSVRIIAGKIRWGFPSRISCSSFQNQSQTKSTKQ
jgi:hypothetical protein